MNKAELLLRAMEEGNDEIDQLFDDRARSAAALISSGLPFTVDRVALLLKAIEEWIESAADDRKIRGEESVLACIEEALATLDELYEPSEEELDLEAYEMVTDSRITQDKEDRS